MLNLVIKIDNKTKNIEKKHVDFLKTASVYDKHIKVIFLSQEKYPQLYNLKILSTQNHEHELLIFDGQTTDEEMIATGLALSEDNDVALLSSETKIEILDELLKKRSQGYKCVRVKKKTKALHQMFRVLGNWSYNIGLQLSEKTSDNFAEAEICYLDGNLVKAICADFEKTRQNRICNVFKQAKHMTIEAKEIKENEPKKTKNEQTMFSYGMWSFIYFLCLIALTSIYPFFHKLTYSWWMILIIVLFVGLGVLLTFLYSKKVFYKRIGLLNRVNNFGEPLFGFSAYYKTGDMVLEKKVLPKFDKPIIKNKIKIRR